MANQQKITCFFRNSKPTFDGLPAKHRKTEISSTEMNISAFPPECGQSEEIPPANSRVFCDSESRCLSQIGTVEGERHADTKLQLSTPQSEVRSENDRKRKAPPRTCDSQKSTVPTARKRLLMDDVATKSEDTKNVQSPQAAAAVETSSGLNKVVTFERKGLLSPKKSQSLPQPAQEFPVVLPLQKTPTKNEAEAGPSAARQLLELQRTPTKVDIRKKLTPEEIKLRLGKVTSLADLKSKLSAVNTCSVKLKEFSSIKVSIPSSPVKSSPVKFSPVKSVLASETQRPAERFHALLQPSTAALPLPYKYKYLSEVFRCVDTVVSMMHNRQERITFDKLKPSVQQMTRRNFTEQLFGQIIHVFPTAYILELEKNTKSKFSPKKGGYELTVTPNLKFLDSSQASTAFQPLEPKVLMERKNVFHNCLLKMMHQHHSEFLASLSPPLRVAEDQITRWHERFDVDSVPDVPATPLPKPPSEKPLSAKDVLEKGRNLGNFPELEAALKTVAAEKAAEPAGSSSTPQPVAESVKPAPPVNPALKGVPQALIDKIRAKEAARAIAAMTISSEDLRKKEMHGRLPELVRITCGMFCLEKKTAFSYADFVSRLRFGYNDRLSLKETSEHVRYLIKVVPEWVKTVTLKGIEYVKIDKNMDENVVIDRLQKTIIAK